MNCQCRLVPDIKVSQSHQNPGRLYYSCQDNKCKWVGWCEPVEDDDAEKKRAQTNDTHGDARMANLEDEFKNLDNLIDGMKEGMQEEFANIKFEVNNAIVDVKRENLKYGIIGFLFAMVMVFISNHI
ncbi:hypothetical protein P8452_47071 [Trifolium repens]|nr:hypothetical protein P8452_47071 [Trifolium repens]